jgi:hypothetical protein
LRVCDPEPPPGTSQTEVNYVGFAAERAMAEQALASYEPA